MEDGGASDWSGRRSWGMYVELVGFGKGGCHFPDVEEDRWGKKGNGVGVEKGVTKGDTNDGCRYVGKGWTVHGGGCANIDSFWKPRTPWWQRGWRYFTKPFVRLQLWAWRLLHRPARIILVYWNCILFERIVRVRCIVFMNSIISAIMFYFEKNTGSCIYEFYKFYQL